MVNLSRVLFSCILFIGIGFAQDDVDVLLAIDGSDLLYSSTADIYGFQFNHDGCASGAGGGDAAANGFTVSASAGVVLAFSFTGSSIPAGSGVLVTGLSDCSTLDGFIFSGALGADLTAALGDLDCEGILGGGAEDLGCGCGEAAPSGCDNACGSTAEVDECGDCGGDGSSCSGEGGSYTCSSDSDVCLFIDGSDLLYNSTADIYGFQFNHDGCALGAGGGDAAANGFTVSASGGVVLAFSFTGSSIPAGSGVLVTGLSDCSTLDGFIFSGALGADLTAALGESTAACDDLDADDICDDVDDCVGEFDECDVCNGSGIADGACDCAGNVVDCAGDCGGDAAEDECGVCNGDGIADGACDCAGNVVDCAGDCGGDAAEDECGECGGDGIG